MNKKALIERANALETELKKLRAEIDKPVVPEGFTPFESTMTSVCPCHPKDEVDVCVRYMKGKPNGDPRVASFFRWITDGWSKGTSCDIIAYKITKKYVQPRPVKFSEIPVGQTFTWGYPESEGPYSKKEIYVKFSNDESRVNSICLGGSYPARFTDKVETHYFSVQASLDVGSLMTVPTA